MPITREGRCQVRKLRKGQRKRESIADAETGLPLSIPKPRVLTATNAIAILTEGLDGTQCQLFKTGDQKDYETQGKPIGNGYGK